MPFLIPATIVEMAIRSMAKRVSRPNIAMDSALAYVAIWEVFAAVTILRSVTGVQTQRRACLGGARQYAIAGPLVGTSSSDQRMQQSRFDPAHVATSGSTQRTEVEDLHLKPPPQHSTTVQQPASQQVLHPEQPSRSRLQILALVAAPDNLAPPPTSTFLSVITLLIDPHDARSEQNHPGM